MTTPDPEPRNNERQPGLGILAARLLFAVQDELYARLAEAGHGEVTHLQGAVFAYLDEDGTRATDLARRSGRHKQVIGRIVDELEALGYVERCPDEADRRAKLVVPTESGREVMRLSDEFVYDIERRVADVVGKDDFTEFREMFGAVVELLVPPPEESGNAVTS